MPMLTRNGWILSSAVLASLALLPLFLPSFWISNILGRSLVYGIVALSLTFLASYGGFISLAQTMIAGVAGYTVAMLAPTVIPLGANAVSYALAIPLAMAAASVAGGLVGLIAVRMRDI